MQSEIDGRDKQGPVRLRFDDRTVTGRSWTGVLVRSPGPEGILEAIRGHRTYASEGPFLRAVEFDPEGVLRVECSPCTACHVRSRGYGVRSLRGNPEAGPFEVDLRVDGYRVRDLRHAGSSRVSVAHLCPSPTRHG